MMKNLGSIRKSLFLIFLVSAANSICRAQEPLIDNASWLDKVNVLAWKAWDPEFPTSGTTWGFEFNLENCPTCLTGAVDYFHQQNELYMSAMQFTPSQQTAVTATEHGCLNLNGDVIFQDENATSESRAFAFNLHHPGLPDIILGSLEGVIDAGADGLTIDGYNPNVQGFQLGGCFDEYTNSYFRDYLAAKFTNQQLQSRFSINDIANFDYKQWIQDNNRENDWNAFPYTDLGAEFFIAEWIYARGFLQEFINHGKQYALANTGRDFSVTENNAGSFWISTDIEDLVSSETFYFQLGGLYFTDYASTNIKISKEFNSAVAFLPEVCTSTILNGEEVFLDIPVQNQNLLKYIFADIYSVGGWASIQNSVIPRLQTCGSGGISYYPAEQWIDISTSQASYFSFILSHRYLFEGLTTSAKLGLVFSMPSDINRHINYSDSNIDTVYRDSHDGFSKILQESNIQYDSVVFGDSRFSSFNTDLEEMSNYEVLLVPRVYAATDAQVQLLLNYIENGGTVLKYGDFGITDEHESLVSRSEILPWANPGTYTSGTGKLISFADDVGSNYSIFYLDSDRQAAANAIKSEIAPWLEFSDEQKLIAFHYDKETNNDKVIHIRNNDFDPEADVFNASNPTTLTIADTGSGFDAILFSPDDDGPQLLATTIQGDSLAVSLPAIEAYAILLLEEVRGSNAETWQARYLPESGELHMPSVQVFGNQYFDIVIRLVAQDPYIFDLVSAEVTQQILGSSVYDEDTEELEIPRVALDSEVYALTMGLVNTNPFQFQLFSVVQVE